MALRVLVVDDQPDLRMLLRMQLELDGHEVVGEAGDGREALAGALRLTPDVIVLDRHLPDGSGLDLMDRLRAASPGVRVIVFSADPEGGETAARAGADAFLDKGAPLAGLTALLGGGGS